MIIDNNEFLQLLLMLADLSSCLVSRSYVYWPVVLSSRPLRDHYQEDIPTINPCPVIPKAYNRHGHPCQGNCARFPKGNKRRTIVIDYYYTVGCHFNLGSTQAPRPSCLRSEGLPLFLSLVPIILVSFSLFFFFSYT